MPISATLMNDEVVQTIQLWGARMSFLLLLLLKNVGNTRLAGRERLTPDQSEDPSPTIVTHRMKEEKGKTGGDKKGASSLGQ